MNLAEALRYTGILAALAFVLQSVDLWQLRRSLSPTGLWSWTLLGQEVKPEFLRGCLNKIYSEKSFAVILIVQGLAALLSLFWPLAFIVIVFTSLAISLRFRGAFNGASDGMGFLLSLALAVGALYSHLPQLALVVLLYIAVQTFLSYLVAGFAKLRSPEWRSGEALQFYLATSSYDVPTALRTRVMSPTLRKLLSWGLMAFEFGALLVFSTPQIFAGWLVFGVAFHLLNFAVLGLNRFALLWIATYPLLYYWSSKF